MRSRRIKTWLVWSATSVTPLTPSRVRERMSGRGPTANFQDSYASARWGWFGGQSGLSSPSPFEQGMFGQGPSTFGPGRRLLVALITSVATIRLCDANAQAYQAQNVAGIRNLSDQVCIVRPVAMDFSMSEAVSTYRQHAEWAQRIAEATPDQKDANLILARARRLSEIEERFETINPAP